MLGIRAAMPEDRRVEVLTENPMIQHLTIAMHLHRDELQRLEAGFRGQSLWCRGNQLKGETPSGGIIVDRLDL
jgi:hypothetical protein